MFMSRGRRYLMSFLPSNFFSFLPAWGVCSLFCTTAQDFPLSWVVKSQSPIDSEVALHTYQIAKNVHQAFPRH